MAEPVVMTSASKEPLERDELLEAILKVQSLEADSERSALALRSAEYNHRYIGWKLTDARQELAALLEKR